MGEGDGSKEAFQITAVLLFFVIMPSAFTLRNGGDPETGGRQGTSERRRDRSRR